MMLVSALPQLAPYLCPGCVEVHHSVTFILPGLALADLHAALEALLVLGDVSLLKRIMIDGAAIKKEDHFEDKNTNKSCDDHDEDILETNEDVLLIKAEDTDGEEMTECLDNPADDIKEDNDFIIVDDEHTETPPSQEDDDESAERKEFDIRKLCKKGEKMKVMTKKTGKVRGPDHTWLEVQTFRSEQEFAKSQSETVRELKDTFTLKRKRRNHNNDVIYEYYCNYTRRKGYNKCPYRFRVLTFGNFPEVVIERIEDLEHDHTRDADCKEQFRWKIEACESISDSIRLGYSTQKIRRILEKSDHFSNGERPTKIQLNNKIAVLRKGRVHLILLCYLMDLQHLKDVWVGGVQNN